MKNLFFLMLSLACVSLEASHFQSSMTVTPTQNDHEFLVEMQIEKVSEESAPELIASPKIICLQGKPAEFKIESEDQNDLLSIHVMIPENMSESSIQTSVLMKEKGQIVLSFDNVTNFNR